MDLYLVHIELKKKQPLPFHAIIYLFFNEVKCTIYLVSEPDTYPNSRMKHREEVHFKVGKNEGKHKDKGQ